MERACQQAVALGLPSIAFTEHADHTSRALPRAAGPPGWEQRFTTGGILSPPALDLQGYLSCLSRCRQLFPGLRILSGVELGEPHWHGPQAAEILRQGQFDRVLASLHVLPAPGGGCLAVDAAYQSAPPGQVIRAYLAEVRRLAESFADFDVLAHIDYAARYWPRHAGRCSAADFEEDYRAVLRVLAQRGKALEVSTRVPLEGDIIRWWHDVKGPAITFASDAHRPADVARGFASAAALAEAAGFGRARDAHGLWMRG
jgi:histidinol-phosphatase (PHP family)